MECNGDFFTHQDLQSLYDAFVDVEFRIEAMREVLDRVKIGDYILGATAEDFLLLVEKR